MKIGAIIQARMSSRRLPGKVLLPLRGKPILHHVVEAVKRAPSLAGVVVATSVEVSDNPISKYCAANNVTCFRGSLNNVAERFLGALTEQGWDGAVRISADSPLLDWRLIEQATQLFSKGDADLVTNVFPRTFPKGQSVEVFTSIALRKAYPYMTPDDYEHVTSYFYTHSTDWRITNFTSSQSWGELNLNIDTSEDLARIELLIKQQELVP